MRLVCPNCGAQYEVDDRVIPEGGRDVQCSSCGHAWYQMPADRDEDVDVDDAVLEDQLNAEEPADEPQAAEPEPEEAGAEDAPEEPEEPAEPAHPAEAPKPREIDEGVRSILQEEAQREMDARAGETGHEPEQVETQPDLGLESGPSPDEERRRIARERMARMRGMDEDDLPEPDFDAHAEPDSEEETRAPHGRDLFPDIEEINSTLDRHEPGESHGVGGAVEAKASRGFGRAFTLVLVIAILLMTLYIVAPRLAVQVPALEPALTAYVDGVNQMRGWLDETLRGLISKIESAAGAE
ncbi:zinc-ribbon domain-containing protein [Sinisalibacter aestuarii]|uniref:Zinc finger/thioredoxin putative domain-containing protein n=1 Tax=Sinisalibacter aestuarii TaxID=2949426 RepID=A0ABQ5LNM9_9RHOB|nr:zinc-ribbon domain-containing protein [Sinisalibacter aestuarii]GKY86223.1 hypothetical protein STA1M1_00920 [Sinisalibacter aestuarii]